MPPSGRTISDMYHTEPSDDLLSIRRTESKRDAQPMGQNAPNQQGPNQGQRPPQQPQQNMNLQQMKMNQVSQQSQGSR
ncbi:hypothetical protein FOXG_19759 [Fusarium oxysporum f. sp. lycopersici 4287]|uniref:Uncharacterized protein n=1 Tax=Fusarium oxysporum f. sp. lycopersici (strain 4287 / CBS 123668 / FGSC 9935 / NRRL 34936) TaxID=426428 RepID=A0A0J9V781_FUSO4|nr:hypothetical protein FOXG_19759 [Fusarium oxysporum f. sp. lycopersici 4287]KNB06691.1 hypothetical protein FOXG_19759 [Fusarium oxysporum f. sp. lycopersici 4287]